MGKIVSKILNQASKNFAFQLGLSGDEWELIQEILGRIPNGLETMIFTILFDERFSQKSSTSLLEGLYRGDESSDIRIGAGECEFDENYNLVFSISSEFLPDKNNPSTSLQNALLRTSADVLGAKAKLLGGMGLLCFGGTKREDTSSFLRDSINGLKSFSNGAEVPIIDAPFYMYNAYDDMSVINSFSIGIKRVNKLNLDALKEEPNLLVYIGEPLEVLPRKITEDTKLEALKIAMQMSLSPYSSSSVIHVLREISRKGLFSYMVVPSLEGLVPSFITLGKKVKKAFNIDLERLPLKEAIGVEELFFTRAKNVALLACNDNQYREINKLCKLFGISSSICGQFVDTDDIEFTRRHEVYAKIPFDRLLQLRPGLKYRLVKYPPMLKNLEEIRNKEVLAEFETNREEELRAERFEYKDKREIEEPDDLSDIWLDLLNSINLCSHEYIEKEIDSSIGAHVLRDMPRDSQVIPLWNEGEPAEGTFAIEGSVVPAISLKMNAFGSYVKEDAYLGTALSLADLMRSLASVGAKPLALAHSLNHGDPYKYLELCALAETIRALSDSCKLWDIPILSDFVDLVQRGSSYYPLPTIVMIGKVNNLRFSPPSTFISKRDRVFLIGETKNEINCSEYSIDYHRISKPPVPEIDFEKEVRVCKLIRTLVNKNLLSSSHQVGRGGLAIALAESSFNPIRPIGVDLTVDTNSKFRSDAVLFSESTGRFIISFKEENEKEVRKIIQDYNISISGDGVVGGKYISIHGAVDCSINLNTAYRSWSNRLENFINSSRRTVESKISLPRL